MTQCTIYGTIYLNDMIMWKMAMETLTATSARKKLFQLLVDFSEKFIDPVRITSLKGSAVLMSDEDYTGMIETINILQNKYLAKKIANGKITPIEDCISMEDLF